VSSHCIHVARLRWDVVTSGKATTYMKNKLTGHTLIYQVHIFSNSLTRSAARPNSPQSLRGSIWLVSENNPPFARLSPSFAGWVPRLSAETWDFIVASMDLLRLAHSYISYVTGEVVSPSQYVSGCLLKCRHHWCYRRRDLGVVR
jgi:hypothetical protein